MTSDKVVIETISEFPDLVFLFYDQEPIWDNVEFLDFYGEQFKNIGSTVILITTQQWGRNLDYYVKKYNWHVLYYFHHAIATQDWFRGYYYHPLAQQHNKIDYHYYSLNRLFDGYRSHRRWLIHDLYHYKLLDQGLVSFPDIDPITKNTLLEAITKEDRKICPTDPQIQEILPITLDTHENKSFEIELKYSKKCFVNLTTETVFDSHENYVSEKSFKPFIQKMPMIVLGTPNTLSTLQQYGFETWHEYWDESYDTEQDNISRYKLAFDTLQGICHRPIAEIKEMHNNMQPILEHNYQNFFSEVYREKIINELFENIDHTISKLDV